MTPLPLRIRALLYLYSTRNIVAMSAKLQGFRPIPDGMIRLQGLEMAK